MCRLSTVPKHTVNHNRLGLGPGNGFPHPFEAREAMCSLSLRVVASIVEVGMLEVTGLPVVLRQLMLPSSDCSTQRYIFDNRDKRSRCSDFIFSKIIIQQDFVIGFVYQIANYFI